MHLHDPIAHYLPARSSSGCWARWRAVAAARRGRSTSRSRPQGPTGDAGVASRVGDPSEPDADPTTCMPAGSYVVAFDFSDAQFTVVGLDEAYCRNLAEAVAVQGKSAMTIERGDLLVVRWPEREAVVEQGACGFEVVSPPVRAAIGFAAGRGVGTADYAVGSSNHPDEICKVRGVRIIVEPG
jgi:hypothetical protein